MSYEQKYSILGLDEYIRQGEPQKRERSEAWKVAIGMGMKDVAIIPSLKLIQSFGSTK